MYINDRLCKALLDLLVTLSWNHIFLLLKMSESPTLRDGIVCCQNNFWYQKPGILFLSLSFLSGFQLSVFWHGWLYIPDFLFLWFCLTWRIQWGNDHLHILTWFLWWYLSSSQALWDQMSSLVIVLSLLYFIPRMYHWYNLWITLLEDVTLSIEVCWYSLEQNIWLYWKTSF